MSLIAYQIPNLVPQRIMVKTTNRQAAPGRQPFRNSERAFAQLDISDHYFLFLLLSGSFEGLPMQLMII